jgi:hypothetical protein
MFNVPSFDFPSFNFPSFDFPSLSLIVGASIAFAPGVSLPEPDVAEVLVSFTEPTKSTNGDLYYGRALGRAAADGRWEGWIEFILAGSDEVATTERESTQPNRADLKYWAQGLTSAYLEGALARALSPTPALAPTPEQRLFVDSVPRAASPQTSGIPRRPVLDPFQVYAEGEGVLRSQLGALSRDHVQAIVEAHTFHNPSERDWVRTASRDALIERVVERVRSRFAQAEAAPVAPAAPAPEA